MAVATVAFLLSCRNDVRAASAQTSPLTQLASASAHLQMRSEPGAGVSMIADVSKDASVSWDASASQDASVSWDAGASMDAGVSRQDFVLDGDGVDGALRRGRFPAQLVDAVDAAFVGRVDLFAHATSGRTFSVWTTDGARPTLVAARLALAHGGSIFAARYDGTRAPAGFYDADGRSMNGTLRARPIVLRRITSRFGERFDAFTGERDEHHGIDYGVPRGTPVFSVGRGRVVTLGHSEASGNVIKIAHADGYESFYLHLERFDPTLHVGSVVEQGQHIADSGNTGHSTGPHLHYELHLAGIPVDPLTVFPMPTVALGPLARREHLAFMKNLEAMHDRRADR